MQRMVPTTPMRKRMKRRETPDQVRFVTFSCFRRITLLSNPRIADLFEANLRAACEHGRIELIAWVIMPEHVHLIARPSPGCPLAKTLLSLKLSVSKTVLPRWRAAGAAVLKHLTVGPRLRFWQAGGGFDQNVGRVGRTGGGT